MNHLKMSRERWKKNKTQLEWAVRWRAAGYWLHTSNYSVPCCLQTHVLCCPAWLLLKLQSFSCNHKNGASFFSTKCFSCNRNLTQSLPEKQLQFNDNKVSDSVLRPWKLCCTCTCTCASLETSLGMFWDFLTPVHYSYTFTKSDSLILNVSSVWTNSPPLSSAWKQS